MTLRADEAEASIDRIEPIEIDAHLTMRAVHAHRGSLSPPIATDIAGRGGQHAMRGRLTPATTIAGVIGYS